jgi:Predicted transcriptional regulators
MDDLTEMLKGVLEGCVLQILRHQESYGYEIVKALNQVGFESVADGTVYPILIRLEKKQLVDVARVRSDMGPPRKVYTLNDDGVRALASYWERWDFIASRLELIKNNQQDQEMA